MLSRVNITYYLSEFSASLCIACRGNRDTACTGVFYK